MLKSALIALDKGTKIKIMCWKVMKSGHTYGEGPATLFVSILSWSN